MRRALVQIFALVAFLVPIAIPRAMLRAEELTAEKALAAFEAASKSVESYDVRLKMHWEWQLQTIITGTKKVHGRTGLLLQWTPYGPNEPRDVMVHYYRQVRLANGYRRIEQSDAENTLTNAGVFDGTVAERYNPSANNASITSHPPAFVRDGDDYSTYIDNASGVFPYAALFRSRPELRLVRDNPLPHTIELDSPPNKGAGWIETGFRLWLDLDHGFMPRRVERYEYTADQLADRSEVTKYYHLSSGIWVPVAAHTTFFVRGKGRPYYGKPAIEVTMDVDVLHSQWNEPVPEQTFKLAIPAGTRVIDQTRRISFTTGAADPGTNIDELVRNAKNVIQYSRGKSAVLAAGGSSWYGSLLGLNGCVVAVLAIVVFFKRRRSPAT